MKSKLTTVKEYIKKINIFQSLVIVLLSILIISIWNIGDSFQRFAYKKNYSYSSYNQPEGVINTLDNINTTLIDIQSILSDINSYSSSIDSGIYDLEEKIDDVEDQLWSMENNGIKIKSY